MKLFIIILFCILLPISHNNAGTIDPNIPDSRYLEYAKDFECIYKICGTYKDKTLFCASAVVIDAHWVLTAAHVVKDQKICFIHKGNKAHEVTKVFIHPDFKEEGFGTADIALCYIDEDIDLNFYPQLYECDDEVNKVCSISGFGLTGTFLTGTVKADGNQRAGSNHIDEIQNDLLICTPSSRTSKKRSSLEFLIGSGDSGGGLFIDGKLAGINSCVLASDKKPDSTYGDEAGHTRVSKFIKWINTTKDSNNEKK